MSTSFVVCVTQRTEFCTIQTLLSSDLYRWGHLPFMFKSKYLQKKTEKKLWSICNFRCRIIFFNKNGKKMCSFGGKKNIETASRFVMIFVLKIKKKWNISHIYWRTTYDLCMSHWLFHSNIFLFNQLLKLF